MAAMLRNLVFEYVRSPAEEKGRLASQIVQQRGHASGEVGEEQAMGAREAEVLLDEMLNVLLEDVLGISWAFLPSVKSISSAQFEAQLQKVRPAPSLPSAAALTAGAAAGLPHLNHGGLRGASGAEHCAAVPPLHTRRSLPGLGEVRLPMQEWREGELGR
jgi:hypothetical protein